MGNILVAFKVIGWGSAHEDLYHIILTESQDKIFKLKKKLKIEDLEIWFRVTDINVKKYFHKEKHFIQISGLTEVGEGEEISSQLLTTTFITGHC